MTGVDPTIETPCEFTGHAVRIVSTVLLVQDLALVRMIVAIRVGKPVDVRNAISDGAAAYRQDANRNIEVVGKSSDLVGSAIAVGVFENANHISGAAVGSSREGILDRFRDPEPAAIVE